MNGPEKSPEEIAAFAKAAARMLHLPVAPEWEQPLADNLKVLWAHAALVQGFALPDEAEPAPVYEA